MSAAGVRHFERQRVVWDSALPPHLKLVALAMLSFAAADGGSIYPSIARVAQMVGKSPRVVQRDVAALMAHGYLIHEAAGGGRAKTTRYRFANPDAHDRVSTEKGDAHDQKPRRVRPETTTPTTENHDAHVTRSIHDQSIDQSRELKERPRNLQKPAVDERFDRFWASYPRKTDKPEARKAWAKLNVTDALFERIERALDWQRQQPGWLEQGGKFVPYPASWLRGERWKDEPYHAPAGSIYYSNTKGARTIAAGKRVQAALDAGAELDPFGTKEIARQRALAEKAEASRLGGWTAECDREHGGTAGSACKNQHFHLAKMAYTAEVNTC